MKSENFKRTTDRDDCAPIFLDALESLYGDGAENGQKSADAYYTAAFHSVPPEWRLSRLLDRKMAAAKRYLTKAATTAAAAEFGEVKCLFDLLGVGRSADRPLGHLRLARPHVRPSTTVPCVASAPIRGDINECFCAH